jgi:hypothetical protein
MEYQLFEKISSTAAVAVKDCTDDFAAEKWAQNWTKANGKADEYILERSGGGFSARVFRTIAGQWYLMRK